jgi:hypothetical protein
MNRPDSSQELVYLQLSTGQHHCKSTGHISTAGVEVASRSNIVICEETLLIVGRATSVPLSRNRKVALVNWKTGHHIWVRRPIPSSPLMCVIDVNVSPICLAGAMRVVVYNDDERGLPPRVSRDVGEGAAAAPRPGRPVAALAAATLAQAGRDPRRITPTQPTSARGSPKTGCAHPLGPPDSAMS